MGAFEYTALDAKGKRKKGVLEADTAKLVRSQLREQGLTPIEVTQVRERVLTKTTKKPGRRYRRKRVSPGDLSLVTRQMATLLAAGIPLDEVLSGVAEQTEKTHIKSILLGVRARVLEGFGLADSMNQFPNAFPALYRTTVAAGEKSGNLDQVLERLADYTERQHEIRQKARQAMIYPLLMTVVSICVVIFMLLYVVPKIVTVFTQTNQTLPLVTTMLIAVSNFVKDYGIYVALILIILGYVIHRLLKRENIRKKFDDFLLRLPVIGRTLKTINAARFARTFGILTAATVPVLEGMNAAVQLIKPLPMRHSVEHAIDRVREGALISDALRETKYFAPMLVHLVASGEASGNLPKMLEKAAANQERDVEALIQSSLTLFEPILILVMGAVVLFIVLAIMLPIFAMDQMPQ